MARDAARSRKPELHRTIMDFLDVVWEPSDVREIRIPRYDDFGSTAAGWFDDPSCLAEEAAEWDGKANIFIMLNPVEPFLLARANNRIIRRPKEATADSDIVSRRWLFIDIDPVRPSGISSTDEELEAACALARQVGEFLQGCGWPDPIEAMSGNGCYLLYPLDLPNASEATELVASSLRCLAAKFDNPAAHIDTTVSNAARIVGLVGTLKVKGDQTADRRHRRSAITSRPVIERRPIKEDFELLLAAMGSAPEPSTASLPSVHSGNTFSVEQLLRTSGIDFRTQPRDAQGVTWYHLKRCPFHGDGCDFECGVGQRLPDGKAAGHCFHPEGVGKGWKEWKLALGFGRDEGLGVVHNELMRLTDLGNAERLVRDHCGSLRYCRAHSSWYFWDGHRWARDNTGEVDRLAKETVRRIYAEASVGVSEEVRAAISKHAVRSESNRAIQAMLARAQVEAAFAIDPSRFDNDTWLFNCQNGTLDLRTGKLRGHDRNDLITKLAPVVFDPKARDPQWEDFLATACEGDVDFVGFLQKFFGYALTGDIAEEKIAFVHGDGWSGKSTFVEAIKSAFGDYAMTADFESFLTRKSTGGPRPDIARLAGARLVVASEIDGGKTLATGKLKQLTGGDTVTARMLYAPEFEFVPRFQLVLVANDAPRLKATDTGAWRRLLRLPFSHRIPEDRQDKELKRHLKTEGRAAVLAWLVEGCRSWQAEGLKVPAAVSQATEEYRRDSDDLADFIEDVLVFEPGAKTAAADLHSAYHRWATGSGVNEPASQQSIATALESRGCVRTRGAHGSRSWKGFRISEQSTRSRFVRGDAGDRGDSSFRKVSYTKRYEESLENSASPASPVSRKSDGPRPTKPPACPVCGAFAWLFEEQGTVCGQCSTILEETR